MTLRVSPGAVGLYGFGILLLYLAGMYFGSYLLLLFLLGLLYPLVSFSLTAAALRRFRFQQSWDQDRPIKGGEINWTLILVNGSFLPLYRVEAHFRASTPLSVSEEIDFRFFLKPRQQIRKVVRVGFPFRGIYTIGCDTVTISDFLQLFRFSVSAEPCIFTVYPSIHKLEAFPVGEIAGEGSATHGFREVLPDFTLFSHLREYRPGESLKHVSWKKFASRGIPLIREYDSVLDNSVRIYLDLRLPPGHTVMTPVEMLTMEDTSVELLVALVHSFLNRGMPTFITVPGSEPVRFFGTNPEHFQDLYSTTLGMFFHETLSPVRFQQAEAHEGKEGGTTIFISHLADAEMQAAAEQAAALKQNVYLILNRVVFRSDGENRFAADLGGGSIGGAKVVVVKHPEEIRRMFAR
ncbi:MAG: DUF58 domain-containing protein [Spirochaetaceae bacterium]|nr:MAG: DUF58 domain-containing protein [Spirochaetaceae bacterium]